MKKMKQIALYVAVVTATLGIGTYRATVVDQSTKERFPLYLSAPCDTGKVMIDVKSIVNYQEYLEWQEKQVTK